MEVYTLITSSRRTAGGGGGGRKSVSSSYNYNTPTYRRPSLALQESTMRSMSVKSTGSTVSSQLTGDKMDIVIEFEEDDEEDDALLSLLQSNTQSVNPYLRNENQIRRMSSRLSNMTGTLRKPSLNAPGLASINSLHSNNPRTYLRAGSFSGSGGIMVKGGRIHVLQSEEMGSQEGSSILNSTAQSSTSQVISEADDIESDGDAAESTLDSGTGIDPSRVKRNAGYVSGFGGKPIGRINSQSSNPRRQNSKRGRVSNGDMSLPLPPSRSESQFTATPETHEKASNDIGKSFLAPPGHHQEHHDNLKKYNSLNNTPSNNIDKARSQSHHYLTEKAVDKDDPLYEILKELESADLSSSTNFRSSIAKYLKPWMKTFKDERIEQLYRDYSRNGVVANNRIFSRIGVISTWFMLLVVGFFDSRPSTQTNGLGIFFGYMILIQPSPTKVDGSGGHPYQNVM
ncbi:hypothetical protein HDU76_013709 [Blyttiomyces sp. JEL0837]|nr:hypothetical protein HDU76_013709 [Blyttiomyces sp. JEL0837]